MPVQFRRIARAGVIALLALAACAHAIAAAPPYWRSGLLQTGWGKKDGAPSSVYSMTQDSAGMLWFAARDGLYHFDGARFERADRVDGNPLLSPVTLCVDAYGDALWVGYQFGGVSVFEGGKARHYLEAQGVPASSIYHFGRTPKGAMWFSSSKGMHWLDGERWRHAGPQDGLPEGATNAFNVLPDGSLLVYFPDGIYRSEPESHRFRRVLAQPGVEGGELRPDGALVINSQQHGMQLFDPAKRTVAPFVLQNGRLPMQGYAIDRRGALWVSVGNGVQLLDRDQRPQKTFTPALGLVGKGFSSMLDDREGNMWLATEAGINRIRETRLTAVELPVGMDAPSVVAGGDGLVWINNLKTQGAFDLPTFGLAPDGQRSATEIRKVSATYRHGDGTIWYASDRTLWRRQGALLQSWQRPAELGSMDTQAMTMDAQGTLWLSIIGKGVYGFRDGAWLARNGRSDLPKRTAVSLMTDAGGGVWFGYTENNLALLDHDKIRQFGAADGLEVGNILVMSRRGERLWVGGERGLAWFDGKRFATLRDADGKGFHGVSGIVETADGELWLHDVDGLVRIDAKALAGVRSGAADLPIERFNYLDGHDGTPSQLRPVPTLVQATDGRLWYATDSSVGWIDPAHIARNGRAPLARVTALKTAQGSYLPGPGITLPAHTDSLEVDFTAAVLSIPERTRFRFRLTGLDTAWRDAGGARQAFYTNLGPGDYRFEVVAANEDGVWSSAAGSVAFSIAPSLTQTIWFKLACGVAVLATLYLLYRWRMAAATARIGERLRERALERERIARTLHDTFLQSLQALILRFDLIKKTLPAADPAQQQIDKALQAADDVINEGRRQVLDLRVTNDYRGDLGAALADFGRETAQQHGVAFTLNTSGAPRRLAAMVQDEVFAIGREALFNAFRHAGGSEVAVDLDYSARAFGMTVRDNGKGVDGEVLAAGQRPGHWGLVGMRERAERIGGTLTWECLPSSGTRVCLRMPARSAYAPK